MSLVALPTMAGQTVYVEPDRVDAVEAATAPGATDPGCRLALHGIWVWVDLDPTATLTALGLAHR